MSSAVSIGSPLKWSNLSKVNLVRRGDVVDVFASGGGIFITMKGLSLDDGVQGGVIKIRNISSDKEFFAKVLNKNSVKVNL
jgi:flagella basal body P-ring formation protein FlgA